jgi:coniferyl-aldehyde dehydrogenase
MNRFTLQFEEIKAAYVAESNPTLEVRLNRIHRIEKMIANNEEKICKVISADFGNRHPVETRLAEFQMIYQACQYARKHLKAWMRPTLVEVPMYMGASQAWLQAQSLGVVGIMSPWNYPIQLAVIPAIAALAAGNRVWLKPSERCSRTSGFLAQLIEEYFHPTEFCVTTGGPEVAESIAALPFDHLFFTGHELVGKKVMTAAANHLTPITLELGGKSPAVIDTSANLAEAAGSIVYGKLLNSGQTCIAPDYVLIQESICPTFIAALQTAAQAQFANPDELTGPIDARQLARWQFLVSDALERGATVRPLLKSVPQAKRVFEPVVLLDVPPDAAVMQEEIFGPILPVLTIADATAAIEYINRHPKPLALYWFGKNHAAMQRILSETSSGGVTINDTLLHISIESLPFGGVGASGMGAYHGKAGFDTFTHYKSVLQVKGILGTKYLSGTKVARPPYGKAVEILLRCLR